MAKTSNIFARVEPDIKDKAEDILNQLGIPMSNAISMYLRQIVLQKGIPFEVKLPVGVPDISAMTEEQLDAELQLGFDDIAAGKVIPAERALENMRGEYGA